MTAVAARAEAGIVLTPEQFRQGSSSSDWTLAVQRAIDEAGPGGRVQLLDPAGYSVEDLTVMENGVVISGLGRDAPGLQYQGTGTCLRIGAPGDLRYRVEVENLRILGVNASAQIGVQVNAPETVLTNVRVIQKFTQAGIHINGTDPYSASWSCKLITPHVTQCAGDGIRIGQGINAVSVLGGQLSSNSGDNLFIHQANGLSLFGTQFEAAGGYEIHCSDRSGTFANPFTLGLSINSCYFETKAASGARALMFDGASIGHRFAMRDCYVYGMETATHAVEANVSSGSVYGKYEDNWCHGFTTAQVWCRNGSARIVPSGMIGLTQFFPSGSALPLLDNTGGGRGSAILLDDLATRFDALRADKFGLGVTPVTRPTGVPVTAAGIHAALVSLGLISA